MNIPKLLTYLPDSVVQDIVNFQDVVMSTGKNAGKHGVRATLDRVLTPEERNAMRDNEHIVGLECTAHYRHAPEIIISYFYLV